MQLAQTLLHNSAQYKYIYTVCLCERDIYVCARVCNGVFLCVTVSVSMCVSVWVCECVSVWVCECVSVWVCECVGVGVSQLFQSGSVILINCVYLSWYRSSITYDYNCN